MTRTTSLLRRWLAAVLGSVLLITVSACGDDEPDIPQVTVTIGEQSADLTPTVYCVDGQAKVGDDDAATEAMQVSPDQQVTIDVPDEVATKNWSIQIWSVADTEGTAVPGSQIGDVPVGTGTSYSGFTTSDAALDRYFIMVVLPEDPDCTALGSAGIWTLLVSRV